jgi:predicted peptidase
MQKRILFLGFILFLYGGIIGQSKVIQLYDGPAPGSESWNWNEAENDNNKWQTKVVYNVTRPSLTIFEPAAGKANGTAVVIAPGGGFHALSINSEGFDVAKWLADRGVTCFVLKYRLIHVLSNDPTAEFAAKMGKKEFDDEVTKLMPLVIADGRNAIAYVRKHAAEYKVDANRIGIMGFSAGGTVASSTIFGYTKENRPDFAAPIYPFFPAAMIGAVSNDAPPIFIATASDDGLGLAPHSIELYNKWLSTKHDAELHMYARGNHGFGMRKQSLPTDNWIERFHDWLGVQGLLTTKVLDYALDVYEKKEFVYNGKSLPYRVLYPVNYDKSKKYPLLLVLHGGGERGGDNEKQLTWGSKLFLTEENRKNFSAIVIFPQCPEDSYWASSTIDRTTTPFKIEFDYTKEPTWALTASNELVKKIISEGFVDKSKVYITGLSMGGMGTFESVYRYPDLYAAALPICGGGDTKQYDKRVAKVPFWIFHGSIDAVVNPQLSRDMVAKLKLLKANVKYTEYPGVNHNSWENAFAEKDYLSWMLEHKKKN